MTAYYNEIDPYAAQWLRNLIAAGHIAPGDVDERSIVDVRPDDLRGYRQCHFFAGIGVWSHSLRLAGWPDDREVWTGSCPCQPFSDAGAGGGFADARHLWPDFHRLITGCGPVVVFGEQVASKDGYSWLDLVWSDMEALEYAFGPVVLPAAGFGAPHGRHRIFFVADAMRSGRPEGRPGARQGSASGSGSAGGMGNTERNGTERTGGQEYIADAASPAESEQAWVSRRAREQRATGGHWANAEWVYCGDDTLRPVEPGTFPLAPGIACRMDKLRAYGNAINAQVAAEFVLAYLEVRESCI